MDDWKSLSLISIGSAIGVSVRFYLINQSSYLSINKHWATCIINLIASFFLGFTISFSPQFNELAFYNGILLFFSVGFLGSLSTFSSFIFELFRFLKAKQINRFTSLVIASTTFGLIFSYIGYLIGNL